MPIYAPFHIVAATRPHGLGNGTGCNLICVFVSVAAFSLAKPQKITMLAELAPTLSDAKIVLASGSPRRREIFDKLGIPYEVVVSNFPEDLDKLQYSGRVHDYVIDNARNKATDVFERVTSQNQHDSLLIIGSDTVVTLDDVILEKPKDEHGAKQMLRRLSGREHFVVSGVVILRSNGPIGGGNAPYEVMFHESTRVRFALLDEAAVDAYVRTHEPLDKAGSYGIQGIGGMLVERIDGDFYNVMGLPLHKLFVHLREIDQLSRNK